MRLSITRFAFVDTTSARLTFAQVGALGAISDKAGGSRTSRTWRMRRNASCCGANRMEPLLTPPEPARCCELGRFRLARSRHALPDLTDAANRLIFHRILGPADANRAEITSSTLLLLPFHRVELEASGIAMHVGRARIGKTSLPIPLASGRHDRVAVWMSAREDVPLKSLVRKGGAPLLFDATPFAAIDVPIAECTLDAECTIPRVVGDVPRSDAEARAKLAASHAVAPQNAIFGIGGIESVITNYDMILLPTLVVRYRYQGQVLVDGGAFSVAMSAYTGKALWESHPPAIRSALGKFRKALSFG